MDFDSYNVCIIYNGYLLDIAKMVHMVEATEMDKFVKISKMTGRL